MKKPSASASISTHRDHTQPTQETSSHNALNIANRREVVSPPSKVDQQRVPYQTMTPTQQSHQSPQRKTSPHPPILKELDEPWSHQEDQTTQTKNITSTSNTLLHQIASPRTTLKWYLPPSGVDWVTFLTVNHVNVTPHVIPLPSSYHSIRKLTPNHMVSRPKTLKSFLPHSGVNWVHMLVVGKNKSALQTRKGWLMKWTGMVQFVD